MRYRARLAYVGTFFHGWQVQVNASRTVQAVVEEALAAVFGAPVRVHASGRTDAGVHAIGQIIHFDSNPIPTLNLLPAVNRRLPWDVRILAVEEAGPDFHARSDARAKRYIYRFTREPVIAPPRILLVAPLSSRAEAARMSLGAERLVGMRDFFPFSTSGTETETTVRTLFQCEVSENGPEIEISLIADGFLRGMARAIAGTLADIGRGHLPVERINEVFAQNTRALVGSKARARGLTLDEVFYDLPLEFRRR